MRGAAARAPVAPAALRTFAFALLLGWVALVALWPEAPYALAWDDGYYYLELARRLVRGEGLTFDGLTPTNGFHPAWLLVVAPFAATLDGEAAMRATLLAQLGVVACAWGALLRGWPALPATAAAALLLWASGPAVVRMSTGGMEPALVLLAHAGLLATAASRDGLLGLSPRRRALAGALLALAFLSRTDAAFLCVTLGLAALGEGARRGRLAAAVPLLLPALLVGVAFIGANLLVFGVPMQVSGMVKMGGIPSIEGRLAALGLGALLPMGLVWAAPRAAAVVPSAVGFVRSTAWYIVFLGLLAAWYLAISTFPRAWYFVPHALYSGAVLALVVADLAAQAAREGRSGLFAAVILTPLALGWVAQARAVLDPRARAVLAADAGLGEWIDASLPPDVAVGSWDAGAVGWFTASTVVNLDGVVGSPAYARALIAGDTTALLTHLTHVANHGPSCEFVRAGAERRVGPRAAGATLLHDVSFRWSGSANGGRAQADAEMHACVWALPDAAVGEPAR